jgi:hypothetical protein
MFDDLDEVLRQLLIRDIPIKGSEVDITFDQPKREWSARLSRPTLNLFLHDIRENVKLRQQGQEFERAMTGTNQVTQRHKAHRIDLHYAITAWAKEPEDEHRLLALALLALFRHPTLTEDLPDSLQDQPAPIAVKVAQYDELEKPSDLWNVMDNQQKPVINCVVTLALHPFKPVTSPAVRTRELVVGQSAEPARQQLQAEGGARRTWTIGGTIRSRNGPLQGLKVVLQPGGRVATLQPEGRFVIGSLDAGEYTLEISAEGQSPARHAIQVPAPDYEFEF